MVRDSCMIFQSIHLNIARNDFFSLCFNWPLRVLPAYRSVLRTLCIDVEYFSNGEHSSHFQRSFRADMRAARHCTYLVEGVLMDIIILLLMRLDVLSS
jgi:hypothetical protein